MKSTVMSFRVQLVRARNLVAKDMLDRDGPYKPRTERRKDVYVRREKHRGRTQNT